MRVVTFAPSRSAVEDSAGGVSAQGFPMTSCYVDSLPAQISLPMVVAVCAEGGTEYNPRLYIVATSPEGERVGAVELGWDWPDNPPVPVKYRVLAQHLPMRVPSTGMYTVGLYDSPDATSTDTLFPLPVRKTNPLTGQR